MTREEYNAYMREWRRKNKERLKEERLARYANDEEYREKLKERSRTYKVENPTKIKQYVQEHKEERKIYQAEYYKNVTKQKRKK